MQKSRWTVILGLVVSITALLGGCDDNGSGASGATSPSQVFTPASPGPAGGLSNPSSSGTSSNPTPSGPPPGSSPPFWISIQETPQSGAAAGNNGVYVIRSNALSSTPSAVTPLTINASLLAVANQPTSGTEGTASSLPVLAMYYATGPDSNVHIYGINLADTSNVPTATQIGSLALNPASGEQICLAASAQRDKSIPQTLFVVVHVTGDSGLFSCAGPDGTYELVNFTDSPTTAPTPVPYSSINIQNIYGSNGKLGGLLTFSASSQLVFYSADQLTGPPIVVVNKIYAFGLLAHGGDAEYVAVTTDETSPAQPLYKVTSSGASSLVYTSQGVLGSAVVDADNLYFTDTQIGMVTTIWQASLQSDNFQPLYTQNAEAPTYLVGSTGSVLIFGYSAINGSATVSTIPLNAPSPQASVLASVPGASFSSAFLDSTATYLYVNDRVTAEAGTAGVPGTAAFTVATGKQLQASSNSMFIEAVAGVLLLSGVADSGDPGGSTIYSFDPAATTQTPLMLADGSPYTVPQGYSLFEAQTSGDIGAINLQSPSSGLATAAVYDSSSHVIVPLGLANMNVSVW